MLLSVRVESLASGEKSESIEDYTQRTQDDMHRMMQELLVAVLRERPANPFSYMIDVLRNTKRAKEGQVAKTFADNALVPSIEQIGNNSQCSGQNLRSLKETEGKPTTLHRASSLPHLLEVSFWQNNKTSFMAHLDAGGVCKSYSRSQRGYSHQTLAETSAAMLGAFDRANGGLSSARRILDSFPAA